MLRLTLDGERRCDGFALGGPGCYSGPTLVEPHPIVHSSELAWTRPHTEALLHHLLTVDSTLKRPDPTIERVDPEPWWTSLPPGGGSVRPASHCVLLVGG